jgi:hypothetical protein
MVQVAFADLVGKLDDIGPLQFLRVEWWDESSKFAVIKYSINDREEGLGLRIDLDKKAILDKVQNTYIDQRIQASREKIWQAVVEARGGA